MADYLLLFSISPVQNFIANSRKTQDLYNGSSILSDLIKSQLEVLKKEANVKLVFPNQESRFMPNRFLIRADNININKIQEIGKILENNFKKRILKLSFDTLKKSDKFLQAQIDQYFQSHWSATEIYKSYSEAYQELERKHAGIKNLRMFKQLGNGNGEQGRKCSLCGENNALIYRYDSDKPDFINDNAISIKNNLLKNKESICTVCALKRFGSAPSFPSVSEIAMKEVLLPEEIKGLKKINIDPEILYQESDISKNLESEKNQETFEEAEQLKKQIIARFRRERINLPKYYALIMCDGDNMGRLLAGDELKSEEDLENFHIELTKALSANAKESSKIIDKAGKPVYAGGDDFMGFCTLDKLLPTLKELRECFEKQVNQKLQPYLKPSSAINMSAGVVIAHYKTPLHIVLNWARNMEKESKNIGGKNSVTLAVLKHSGDLQKHTWQWGEKIDKMHFILKQLNANIFSTNFIYTLDKEFRQLDYETNVSYDRQFETELKRLILRSVIDQDSETQKSRKQLEETCLELKSSLRSSENYFDLMRILAFLHRETGGTK